MGVLCLFLGGVFVWVASHGTKATSPWEMFQQIIAGFSGTPAGATRPADPWDAVGVGEALGDAAQAVGAAVSGASGASGSSLSHRSRPATLDDTINAGQKILDSPDTTRSDQAAAAAAQRKLDQIQHAFDGTGLG